MGNLSKVVYLTKAQAETLFANGTITVDGVTVTYSADDLYVTPAGDVTDVQVNGSSIVNNGVANVPVASSSAFGVVLIDPNNGINVRNDNNKLTTNPPTDNQIKSGSDAFKPITVSRMPVSIYYGLSKLAGEDLKNDTVTVGTYPEKSKSAISQMLDAPETVSGTTPSITAKAGVRYICGECATLTIVVPSSGIIDVTFDSGTTPTVLTVTPPTGMTMRWIGDDPTALEANKHYEVNIADGCNGMVVSWT